MSSRRITRSVSQKRKRHEMEEQEEEMEISQAEIHIFDEVEEHVPNMGFQHINNGEREEDESDGYQSSSSVEIGPHNVWNILGKAEEMNESDSSVEFVEANYVGRDIIHVIDISSDSSLNTMREPMAMAVGNDVEMYMDHDPRPIMYPHLLHRDPDLTRQQLEYFRESMEDFDELLEVTRTEPCELECSGEERPRKYRKWTNEN